MSADNKKSLDPTVLAAIITVVGGIITTVIIALANRTGSQPATSVPPTEILHAATVQPSPIPTSTVPTGEPTSSPAPPTDTPTATLTPVIPVALGKDWMAGCISTLWKLYPADIKTVEREDGCWQEPVFVFRAENGDLDFLAQNQTGSNIFGLFAQLPTESGSVTFVVRLRDLENVDLLMGVFADQDVTSQGILMTIPQGNVKKRVIAQKDNVNSYTTLLRTGNLDQGDGYSFTFNFTLNSVRSTVNPSVFVTNPVSVPSAKKWLFLGYKVLGKSYRVDGTFLELELK